jgi:hypothetical protein
MATNPAFLSTARYEVVNVATANTAIDGTGTITSLITGVAAGTRVLEVNVQCAATSAAALVNLFISANGGTTWRLFDQIAVTAATASNTVKANRNFASYINLILPSTSHVLGVTTSISQSTNVVALGGDLT